MRFWFDTEFYEDGRIIDLISIGVVAEDGRTYYAETETAHLDALRTEWLRINVAPHIRVPAVPGRQRSVIARELVEFFGREPEIWAYYGAYDWVVLCQLYGPMIALPEGWPMFVRDVKQLCDSLGNPKLPKSEYPEHDAMGDALWTRDAWRWLHARINYR